MSADGYCKDKATFLPAMQILYLRNMSDDKNINFQRFENVACDLSASLGKGGTFYYMINSFCIFRYE